MRFDTLQEAEAELEKAEKRGERAFIQPPDRPTSSRPRRGHGLSSELLT
jgi:hypothetical protein